MTREPSNDSELQRDVILEPHEHIAFHATLQQTHDDDILDQAVAALPSLIIQRRDARGMHYHPFSLVATQSELLSMFSMLSAEASIRSNLTAAQLISGQTINNQNSESLLSIAIRYNKAL